MIISWLHTCLLWGFIIFQTLLCLILVFLLLLQKGDDGGIGSVFFRTAILYNRSENLFTRKIIVGLSLFVFLGSLGLSVYFYKVNKNKFGVEQLIQYYNNDNTININENNLK